MRCCGTKLSSRRLKTSIYQTGDRIELPQGATPKGGSRRRRGLRCMRSIAGRLRFQPSRPAPSLPHQVPNEHAENTGTRKRRPPEEPPALDPLENAIRRHLPSASQIADIPDSVTEMALIAEMCDHGEWWNAEGFLLREKVRPTLSTVGRKEGGVQAGLWPLRYETCSSLSAEFWNVSAPPWSANGVIFPPTFGADCLNAGRASVHKATSPPAEQSPNFFATKQRSGALLLILLV
jgi:hypothetical protein